MIRSVGLSYDASSVSLVLFIMFSTYVSVYHIQLTTRNVFVALAFITSVRYTSILNVVMLLFNASEARVAWKRIKVIL